MKKIITLFLLILSLSVKANPINLIVGFPPGGSFDTLARKFATYAEKELKTNIIVSNVPGASTSIALSKLDTGAPNTLMLTGSVHHTVLHSANTPLDKYKYIGVFGESYLYLAVSKKQGLSCKDFTDKNNKFFIGTAEPSTSSNIAGLMIVNRNFNLTEVPYRGVPLQTSDLLSNRIQMSILVSLGSNRSDYTIIANTSANMLNGFPSWNDCLGVEEILRNQFMLIAKSESSDELANKINQIVIAFVKDTDTMSYFKENGIVGREADINQVKKLVNAENKLWNRYEYRR